MYNFMCNFMCFIFLSLSPFPLPSPLSLPFFPSLSYLHYLTIVYLGPIDNILKKHDKNVKRTFNTNKV